MVVFWLYVHGYHSVTLLGGATSRIGDPSGRLASRESKTHSERTANMVAMHYQMKRLWLNVEIYARKYGYEWNWSWKKELVNNNRWINKLPIMDVLSVLGPGLRMGAMLAKDTVRNKMEKGDGMSFAEFSYPILQAWDWWHMYNTMGVQLQIGGSDQYGNITAGVDAIKYISANHPHEETRAGKDALTATPMGLTTPLLTTSSGQKLGKSAGNAIWLDKDQTSVFDLYGYWMKQSDSDVGRFLKLFTFMPIDEIDALMKEHLENPKERKAQRKLAQEFVELVHGEQEAKNAARQHGLVHMKPEPQKSIRQGPLTPRDARWAEEGRKSSVPTLIDAPSHNVVLPRSLILGRSMARITRAAGLAESNSDAQRLIQAGSIYIGGQPTAEKKPMYDSALSYRNVRSWVIEDNEIFLLNDDLLFLRRGKGLVKIIKVVSDEEWQKLGLSYPGESGDKLHKVSGMPAPQSTVKKSAVIPETTEQVVSQDKAQE